MGAASVTTAWGCLRWSRRLSRWANGHDRQQQARDTRRAPRRPTCSNLRHATRPERRRDTMVGMHQVTRARARTSPGSNKVMMIDGDDGNGDIESLLVVGAAVVQHVRELRVAGRDSDVVGLLHARRTLVVGWLLGDLVQCTTRDVRAGSTRTATTVHTSRLLEAVHAMVQLDDLVRQSDGDDGDAQPDAMRSLPPTDDDWRAWCMSAPSAPADGAPGGGDGVVNDSDAAPVVDVNRTMASLASDQLPLTDAVWQRWASIDQDAWLAAVTALAQLVMHGTATKRHVSRAFSTHLISARRALARAAGASIPLALAPSLWPRLPSAIPLTLLLILLALDRAFDCVASHPPTASDRSRIITMLRLHTQPTPTTAASTTGTDLATGITRAHAPWPLILARTAHWLTSARAPSGLTTLATFYCAAPEPHVATALRTVFRTAISASADSDTAPIHPILAAGVLMLARVTRAEPAYAAWLAALVHRDAWSVLIPHAPTARRALKVLESLVPWDRAQILRVHARALTVGSAATASRTSNVAHVRPALRVYLNAITDRVGKVPPEDAVRVAGVVLGAYVPPRDPRAARARSAAEVGKLGAGGGKDAAKRVPAKLAQFLMVRVKWVITALLPALWRRAVEKGGEERVKVASLMADLVLCGKVPTAVFDQWVRVRDDDEEVGEEEGETAPGSQTDRTPTPVGSDAMDVDGPVGNDAVFVVPRIDLVVDREGVRVVADTTTAAPAVNAVADTWRRLTAVSTAPMTTTQLAHLARQFYETMTTGSCADVLVPVRVCASSTPVAVLPSLRARADQLNPFVPPLAALVLAWSLVPLAPFPDPTDVFMQALLLATISSTTAFPVLTTLPCGLTTSPIAPNAWPLPALHKLLASVSRSSGNNTATARAIRAVTTNLPPPTVDDAVYWCTTSSPSSSVLLTPPIRVAGSAADLVATCVAQPHAAVWIAASLVPTVTVTEGPVRAALNAFAGRQERGSRAARSGEVEEMDEAVAYIVRTHEREVDAGSWGTAARDQARAARVAARHRAVVGAPRA
ncbi:hypothetical protein AMAG_16986 [Allomyces macrogynus ATCC 38327]|uniref:Uncharacterized protein n=1 Tax=Allomyces macrogynus (strain ATCC 38327) TaxID=578462 RepID=A0A0L0TCT1_ALLM3|nr:hypothetical protein AMAG_16986 [Allomyces macrogynus ATCC 38327]|eukprot:KNE72542.1 hypothetical protein AMAG_16986 [Allomyces macrogynus ATCC 38327]